MEIVQIQSKEDLFEILTKLNKNVLIVDISEIGEVFFFTVLSEFENLNFERQGFKKWKITKKNIPIFQTWNRIYSYFLIIVGILLNIYPLKEIIINNWLEIEHKFTSLPIAAGIVATILTSVVVGFKNINKFIKSLILRIRKAL